MQNFTKWFLLTLIGLACNGTADRNNNGTNIDLANHTDTLPPSLSEQKQQISLECNSHQVISKVTGSELVDFAKTLIGIPYKYASSNPLMGFDCSGFITHVFNHFNIEVPRSSIDFTNMGKEVELRYAKKGDLILFTGTVDTIRIVGHMGIITENIDTLKFIQATSGKAYGVTISVFNTRYQRRFVKVIRVLSN